MKRALLGIMWLYCNPVFVTPSTTLGDAVDFLPLLHARSTNGEPCSVKDFSRTFKAYCANMKEPNTS